LSAAARCPATAPSPRSRRRRRVTAAKWLPGAPGETLGATHDFADPAVARSYAARARARGFMVRESWVRPGDSRAPDPARREGVRALAAAGAALAGAAAVAAAGPIGGALAGGTGFGSDPPPVGPLGTSTTQVALANGSDPAGAPVGSVWYRTDLGVFRMNSGIFGVATFAPSVTGITSPDSSLAFSAGAGGVTGILNVSHANTWSALQTFGTNLSVLGAGFAGPGPTSGQLIQFNGTHWVAASGSGSGLVDSVANTDGTLSISPTTGNVVASLALGHANSWSALQTFGNNLSFGGGQVSMAGLATGNLVYWNGSNWVNSSLAPGTGITIAGLTITNAGVTSAVAGNGVSVSAATGAVTFAAVLNGSTLSLGASGLSLNLGNANSWAAVQTFGNNVSIGGYGAFNVSSPAKGDLWYYDGAHMVNLPIGTAGYILQVVSGVPAWVAASSVGVTSLNGLTGALTVTSPNATLSVGTSGSNVTVDLNSVSTWEFLLSTTSPTTVATRTPSASGNYPLWLTIRVVTATTNVLVTVTFNDGAGPQTYTPVNLNLKVGTHLVTPVGIPATTGANIVVTATAGAASQVYISAGVLKL
jgi:hypothetical protein